MDTVLRKLVNDTNYCYPKWIDDFPPGGWVTREEGRSVMTFPEFMLDPLANLLHDIGRPRFRQFEGTWLEVIPHIFSSDDSCSVGWFFATAVYIFLKSLWTAKMRNEKKSTASCFQSHSPVTWSKDSSQPSWIELRPPGGWSTRFHVLSTACLFILLDTM